MKNDYNTKLTITDGTFTGAGSYNVYSEGTVEVSGGSFSSNGSNFLNSKDGGAGTLTVSGGNFAAGNGKSSITLWGKPTTTITGGTFNASNLTSVSEEDWGNLALVFNTKAPPANTVILTDEAPVVKYEVVEGKDQTWMKSTNESVKYVLNADATGIVKVARYDRLNVFVIFTSKGTYPQPFPYFCRLREHIYIYICNPSAKELLYLSILLRATFIASTDSSAFLIVSAIAFFSLPLATSFFNLSSTRPFSISVIF